MLRMRVGIDSLCQCVEQTDSTEMLEDPLQTRIYALFRLSIMACCWL
jgi:hypothetical protein